MPAFHPIQPILVAILAAVLYYLRRKSAADSSSKSGSKSPAATTTAPKPGKPKDTPELLHQRQRQQALKVKREALGLPALPADSDELHGLLMEMQIAGSVATLACFANGDAILLSQAGTGLSAGARRENVREAVRQAIALAQQAFPRMTPATTQPLPGADQVRFYALTPRGVFGVDTDRATAGQPSNALSPLFYAGQEVVSQMRKAETDPARA